MNSSVEAVIFEMSIYVMIVNVGDIHGQIVGWSLGGRFARKQTAPGFMTLVDNLQCVFLVFGFSGESKGIFRLAIRDFVDPNLF